jgi:hypothetical protein
MERSMQSANIMISSSPPPLLLPRSNIKNVAAFILFFASSSPFLSSSSSSSSWCVESFSPPAATMALKTRSAMMTAPPVRVVIGSNGSMLPMSAAEASPPMTMEFQGTHCRS